MVHVAIAGGSGNVGCEIVRELVEQGKHQVTVLSRKDLPDLAATGIRAIKVNYSDKAELTAALQSVHTVLSFIVADPECTAQKALIDASVAAGVKRFAPSEWGSKSESGFPGFGFRGEVHEYLKKINAEDPVLEYCLFQPGTFMNYLSYPHRSAAHLAAQCIGTDIGEKHALMTEDGEAYQVFTTVQDLAKVVARAIGFEGKWPKTGGVVGSRIQQRKIVELAEKHAGTSVQRHLLKIADLENDELLSAWIPPFYHPSMRPEMMAALRTKVYVWRELAVARGAMDMSPTWNELLPDMKFTSIDTFLAERFGDAS